MGYTPPKYMCRYAWLNTSTGLPACAYPSLALHEGDIRSSDFSQSDASYGVKARLDGPILLKVGRTSPHLITASAPLPTGGCVWCYDSVSSLAPTEPRFKFGVLISSCVRLVVSLGLGISDSLPWQWVHCQSRTLAGLTDLVVGSHGRRSVSLEHRMLF